MRFAADQVANRLAGRQFFRHAHHAANRLIGRIQRAKHRFLFRLPQIQWDCDYYSGNKVQLNGDIQVTLTQRVDIGFFVFGSFPIELKARASGKSEVYYK